LEADIKRHELESEYRRATRENRPKEELYDIVRKLRELPGVLERDVRATTREHESMKKGWESELAFFQECINWVRSANFKLRTIRTQSRQELKRIEKLQALELNELFPPTDDSGSEPGDLNSAIADALASHAAGKSPVDSPSLRAYGDFAESTRSEKSGVSSWSLLGIRGLEAVQVSSQRGPPTDRPPDIPPGKVGVLAGCLLERAGTPSVSQLASFSRGSNSSSGNASPLQKMQIGGCAPSNYSASHAAGTSQESSTRTSRAGRLGGVVGSD
jgi:hypothetical protein